MDAVTLLENVAAELQVRKRKNDFRKRKTLSRRSFSFVVFAAEEKNPRSSPPLSLSLPPPPKKKKTEPGHPLHGRGGAPGLPRLPRLPRGRPRSPRLVQPAGVGGGEVPGRARAPRRGAVAVERAEPGYGRRAAAVPARQAAAGRRGRSVFGEQQRQQFCLCRLCLCRRVGGRAPRPDAAPRRARLHPQARLGLGRVVRRRPPRRPRRARGGRGGRRG